MSGKDAFLAVRVATSTMNAAEHLIDRTTIGAGAISS